MHTAPSMQLRESCCQILVSVWSFRSLEGGREGGREEREGGWREGGRRGREGGWREGGREGEREGEIK